MDDAQDTTLQALTGVAAIGAGLGTRRLLARLWTDVTGRQPPRNPADPDVGWREALVWAAAAGAAVGIGRVVGRRLASGAHARLGGGDPARRARSVSGAG